MYICCKKVKEMKSQQFFVIFFCYTLANLKVALNTKNLKLRYTTRLTCGPSLHVSNLIKIKTFAESVLFF